MSKLSFDLEDTRIVKCRKLSTEDTEEAKKLISATKTFLGKRNVEKIIQKSFISVCALNHKDQMVGFLCLHDHPGIPYLIPSEWEFWLKGCTNFKNATSQNSLWIHYIGFHPGYAFLCLRPIFEHVYHNYPHLKHIFFPSSPILPIPENIKEHFDPLVCRNQHPNFEHKILINLRHNYVIKYKIRRAVTLSFNNKTCKYFSTAENSITDINDISSDLLQDSDREDQSENTETSSDSAALKDVFPSTLGHFDKPRGMVSKEIAREDAEIVAFLLHDEAESLSLSSELNKSVNDEENEDENTSSGNAFAVEIYASEKMHEKPVLPDILEAAFQCFPNKDYCIFTIPSEEPHSPLFDMFVRVVPKADSVYPQELCVLHRNALRTQMSIRKMNADDYETVKKLITDLSNNDPVYFIMKQYIKKESLDYTVYVVLNYDAVIGFIVIRPANMINYFWEHFLLEFYIRKEDYKFRNCGVIENFHILTIYYKQMQFILRELHRLTDMPIFFYKLNCIDLSIHSRRKPLPIILNNFFPVTPRRNALFKSNTDSKQLEGEEKFALYIYSARVCSFDRIAINSRLVVVGASTAGLSFISTLLYSFDNTRHLVFNNITLVHDQNINEEITCDIAKDMFIYNGYSISRLFYIYLYTSISVVKGKMTAIDRTNKYITIDGNEILPYDLLFLMTGAQNHGTTLPRDGRELPINIFIINQPKHASHSLEMLQTLIQKKKKPKKKHNVIVYGNTLSAYCCLGVLQRLEIPNLQIIFVHPIPEDDLNYETELFNNPDIQDAVRNIIELNNIIIYKGYTIREWTLKSKINAIKSVTIETRQQLLKLDCIAIFYYEEETVDYETFLAVYKAGLVYDGKLVIQCNCSVNDPYIFACGPMTKYSRKYYADNCTHLYFNSAEIGASLAVQVRSSLIKDELKDDESENFCKSYQELEKKKLVVPQYRKPVTKSFKLPGGYSYFIIETPGKRVPIEFAMDSKSFGRFLVTGNLDNIFFDKDPSYFLIKINPHGVIKQITCLTKRPLALSFFESIWGKHESLFNNLVMRYDAGMIDDFFTYFEQPCFAALFFNKFDTFHDDMFTKLKIFATKVLEEEEQKRGENCPMDLAEKIEVIKEKFLDQNYADIITKDLLYFLEEHIEYLPMYAHDIITRGLLNDSDDSIL